MPAEFVSFINILLVALVSLAVPFLTMQALSWLSASKAALKAKLSAEQWRQLEAVVTTVVQAAEQSGAAGKISDEGEIKFAWAMSWLKTYVADHGFEGLAIDDLAKLVEAKVYEVIKKPAIVAASLMQGVVVPVADTPVVKIGTPPNVQPFGMSAAINKG